MSSRTITINRAPVLTLWATVVAERIGFNEAEALSLGKALAALNAQSKGRRLGIYKPHEEGVSKARQKGRGEEFWIELCGRPVPARNTEDGVRAVSGAEIVSPAGAKRYLESKFGEALPAAWSAMKKLAESYPPKELCEIAFALYERFRPQIPAGVKGWGAKGELNLDTVERLSKHLHGARQQNVSALESRDPRARTDPRKRGPQGGLRRS
jgi:hypothetical protein